mgnify:CR=1 FL=1
MLAGCGKLSVRSHPAVFLRVALTHAQLAGCSKRLSSKAAASEEARRRLRDIEPLSDARTPQADFFSILLDLVQKKGGCRDHDACRDDVSIHRMQ